MFGLVRALGVDPGLTRCGVGVVEGRPGVPPKLIAVGVVQTDKDDPHPQRLLRLEAGLEDWIDAHSPDVVAVERVFAEHNLRSVMGTAQAAGIAMVAAARQGVPVAMHSPTEVKAAVTGFGGANKAQVGAMVARILRLTEPPKPADAADAVALAICHVWRGGVVSAADAPNRYAQAVAEHKAAQRTRRSSAR